MEDTAREKMRDKVCLEPGPCSVSSDAAQPVTAAEKSNEVLPNKELVACMSRNTANKDGEDKSVLEPTQAVTFPDVKNLLQMSAKMEQMAGSSTRSGSEEDNSSTGPTQAPVLPNIKSELKEQPVAVSVSFAFADTSNILWQHRKSSSPMSILPDIVEDDTQDEAQCEDSGEQFDVVDLTVDSEEDSRGTETQQFLLAAASSGDRGTAPLAPLKLIESGNTKKQSFMCVSCKKYYISVSNLQRSVDGTGIEYHCTMCPLVFNLEKSFCKHLKNHSMKQILFCQQCKDLFGSRSFFCYVCKQEFANGTQLEAHQKTHEQEPLTCPICMRRFATQTCLNEHENLCIPSKVVDRKVFRGLPWQRLFRCPMCQEQFLTQKMLAEHRTNCIDNRPKPKYYECDICAEHFLSIENMAAHKLSHNTQMASFPCDSCGLKFLTAGGLASHKITHKKYPSCSPSKKQFLSEPESSMNESVSQSMQPVKNMQIKQETVTIEKKVTPPLTVVKSERLQKNSIRQRFLLPKSNAQKCKSPVNPNIQNQQLPKNQLSLTYNSLHQQTPKVHLNQYQQQLPGNRIIQHQFLPTNSVFQPQMLPGGCIPQLQHIKVPEDTSVPQNVAQNEQFVSVSHQQSPASSVVPCDVTSNTTAKHQEMLINSGIQYQHVPTNNAGQYQLSNDDHSQQQVATNNSFHHLSTAAVQCQEMESENSGQHQQLLGLTNMQNQQSSVYNNMHSQMTNNSFHNQQNINAAQYNNVSVNTALLPQHLSTNNTPQNLQLPTNNVVGNHQQLTNSDAQNQQWSVNSAHQMSTNTNQYQLLPQNSNDQLQQHLSNVSNQQTLLSVGGTESQNLHNPQHQQVNQVVHQQIMSNSAAHQQAEANIMQNSQFSTNNATYQLFSTNSVQQQVQTNDTLANDQNVTNPAQTHQFVVSQNQQGINNVTQNQHLSVQNQLLGNTAPQNHPLLVNSTINQQFMSNADSNQAQNQQILAANAQSQLLFQNNTIQNQHFTENSLVQNQHLFENDSSQKQHSPEDNALQNQQSQENNSQDLQLFESNPVQSQQSTDISVAQKESQTYGQQMSVDTAVQTQQLFANGSAQNQHFSVNQHSMNSFMHNQQPTMCFPFQHQAFPANVVILQPQMPENGAFHQVAPSVSQQQQLQASNIQQQQQQQYKLPSSVYPASFMYHLPANNSLAHLPQNMLPASMVYQLANFGGQQGVTQLPINLVPQHLPGGVPPQGQMFPGFQQVLLANNTFLPGALPQHQQFSVGSYPQPRVLLPPPKQDSASPDRDRCCDVCGEEQKAGSVLCHHGKKYKRVSESSGIIVQFVPNHQGMHHTVVNIQAPPENVTVVKSS